MSPTIPDRPGAGYRWGSFLDQQSDWAYIRGIMIPALLVTLAALVGGQDEESPEQAVQRWMKVLATEAEGGQFEALRALIALGEVATEPCIEVMSDPAQSVPRRWQSAMILGNVGGARALPELLDIVRDEPNETIAVVATESVGTIGGKSALEGLELLLDKELSDRRREALERVLIQLGSSRVEASQEAPWVQPPIRTGIPFVEALPWAEDLEAALDQARQEKKLVLATVVPIADQRWSSGYRAAPSVWEGTTPHPWGDERVMAIDSGLVKERALLASIFADPEVAHLVREHFVPVRLRLHTYHFDGQGRGPDPLPALGISARELSGPALIFARPTGKLVHACKGLAVLSAPMVRAMIYAVLDKGRVRIKAFEPADVPELERAWDAVSAGDPARAREALARVDLPEDSPRFFEAVYLRGQVARLLDEPGEALRHWSQAAAADGDGPWGGKAQLQLEERGPRLAEWESLRAFEFDPLAETTEVGASPKELGQVLAGGVRYLLGQQRGDGGWQDPSYDVHPASGPGSRYDMTVARTGLVVDALLTARPRLPELEKEIDAAVERGIACVGRFADDPKPYVWQLTYALHLQVALLRASVGDQDLARRRAAGLVEGLRGIQSEGGWSYMQAPRIHSFNTAPVLLLLVEASTFGVEVPSEMTLEAAAFLAGLRAEDEPSNFAYAPTMPFPLRASSCRTALCELALGEYTGERDTKRLSKGVALFFEFEPSVRSTTKIYESYFSANALHDAYHYYFGHYYVARALGHLPKREARRLRKQQTGIVLSQRELDGSFVDAQMQGKSYSTAMALLTLLENSGGAKTPRPVSPDPDPGPSKDTDRDSVDDGLALRYPGDAGIEKDPAVILVETFGSGTPAELKGRWSEANNTSGMAFVPGVRDSADGNALEIRSVGGTDNGGHLYNSLAGGYDEIYLRYYVRYDEDSFYHHTGGYIGGFNPATAWPQGLCCHAPEGDFALSAAFEIHENGEMDFYNYWADMKPWGLVVTPNQFETDPRTGASKPKASGNGFLAGSRPVFNFDRWYAVEFRVKVGTPGVYDGELSLWVDGQLVNEWGPGYPSGHWEDPGTNFVPDPTDTTSFGGFRWRTDEALRLNWIWLAHYDTTSPVGHTSRVSYDNIIVATEYIGPIAPTPSRR